MTQRHVWDLPGWKGAVTIAQLQYGAGLSFEDSFGWFWPDGQSSRDDYLGADPWGWLWVRADTPLRQVGVPREAHSSDSQACVWLVGTRQLALYLPTHKHGALVKAPASAHEVGWLRVDQVAPQPPGRALARAWA